MRFLFVALALCATGSAALAEPDEYHLPGAKPVVAAKPQQPMDTEVAALKARIVALEVAVAMAESKLEQANNKLDAILLALEKKANPTPPPNPTPEPPKEEAKAFPIYVPLLLDGAKKYSGDGWTQEIFTMSAGNVRIIRPFPIKQMSDTRWNQPGGMEGVKGWKAEKFKYLPEGTSVRNYRDGIAVKTDSGSQVEIGIKREYPIGTRFDEVLTNAETGKVFEHRVREKIAPDGFPKWISRVEFSDEAARPVGYSGLKVSCSSCHSASGTGAYADGLVPGGDSVLSDPIDLSLANAKYDPNLRRR